MNAQATTPASEPRPEWVPTFTLMVVALIALAGSWGLPWWVMRANAPQYGQRTLEVLVSPRGPTGDVFEVDGLGHYVGIQPMATFAPLERKLAPFGFLASALAIVSLGVWRKRWLRLLCLVPVLALPIGFLADLKYWTEKSVNERDPDAALNLTVTEIDTKLFGRYEIGQFKVNATMGDGLRMAGITALLTLGLAFSGPLPLRRRRRGVALAGAGLAAGALVLLAGANARAATLSVAPGESIADTLARASEGDVIQVPAGVYRERLSIDRKVTVEGAPGAVIDGEGTGTVVRVLAPGVALKGLTIRGSGANFNAEDAAVRVEAADVVLERLVLDDALFGVFALQADRCVIDRCAIVGKDLEVPKRGDGIRLWYSSGCRLTHNEVERSRDVVIWYSSDTVVEDNRVRHSRYGLHYMYSDHNVFRRNRFEDNEVGAAIMYSKKVELTENAFSFSTGPSAVGLLVKDADDIFIRGNRFIANASALFFDGAPQSRGARVDVVDNLVARNDVGVVLQPSSRGLRFWGNAFVGNRTQVQVQGETSQPMANSWSVEGRGNYWSDAVLYDRDGDGVSELPYRAESTYESLSDRRPELAFFAGTPAAEAIDGAARLFPIFEPRERMVDPHPLMRPPLTRWTESRDAADDSPALALVGLGLLAGAGLMPLGAKRWLS